MNLVPQRLSAKSDPPAGFEVRGESGRMKVTEEGSRRKATGKRSGGFDFFGLFPDSKS